MNDNPDFYRTVTLNGEKIATIKAKTHLDEAELQKRCYRKKIVDGKIEFDIEFELINIIRIRQALTGDEKVGWESDVPVTEKNIANLEPEYWNALLTAVNEIDESWKDENVSKN